MYREREREREREEEEEKRELREVLYKYILM